MHGHLLGAAGAIEALATILSIQNDAVPPTINHFTDDPDIPKLDFTFNHKKNVSSIMLLVILLALGT